MIPLAIRIEEEAGVWVSTGPLDSDLTVAPLLAAGLPEEGEDLTTGAERLTEEEEEDTIDEVVSMEELVSSFSFLRASCLTYIGLYIQWTQSQIQKFNKNYWSYCVQLAIYP